MRKLLFILLTISVQTIFAQDLESLIKKAKKSLDVYNLDNFTNLAKLKDAIVNIEEAGKMDGSATSFKYNYTRAQIMNDAAKADHYNLALGKTYIPADPKSALNAYQSIKKAYDLSLSSTDKNQKKDAIGLMKDNQDYLNSVGVYNFDNKDVPTAYAMFKAVYDTHNLLRENGKKSKLDKFDDYKSQLELVAVTGYNAGKESEIVPVFDEMVKNKMEKAYIYEAYYKIYESKDPAKAVDYLTQGRTKYPEDSNLLFAEINYYLKKGEMDKLIDKIKTGIAKEPKNVSLYLTLGNVYDNMALKETDPVKAQQLQENALENYKKTIEFDPKNGEALYNIGASYYNKAAALTKEMNAQPSNAAGNKRYDELNKQMKDLFGQALPYFQDSEKANPNELNTLIALKEIFAKLDKMDLTSEFKKRIETVQAGGKNVSYFAK